MSVHLARRCREQPLAAAPHLELHVGSRQSLSPGLWLVQRLFTLLSMNTLTLSVYRRFLLVGTALLCSLPATSRAADPDATTSEYFRITMGMVTYSKRDNSNRLDVTLAPLKSAPGGGPLYLEARFENPQRGVAPLIQRGSVPAGSKQSISLSSRPLRGVQNGRVYSVTVLIYSDPALTPIPRARSCSAPTSRASPTISFPHTSSGSSTAVDAEPLSPVPPQVDQPPRAARARVGATGSSREADA